MAKTAPIGGASYSALPKILMRDINPILAFSFAIVLVLMPEQPATAQERLCDTAFEDCRSPLWTLIDSETVGIDVAFWFMDDVSYVPKLINKFNSGVPVRVLIDPRGSNNHPVNAQVLNDLQAAGIPMRKNVAVGGVLHWKMMLFVGQNKVQFSAANYGPANFVPTSPYADYIDEIIYFSDNTSIVNSFKTKFDDKWIDTNRFANYANISGPLTRKYPIFTKNPELNFPPEESFANRSVSNYNEETTKIDAIIFRNTDDRHTNALISALGRLVTLRILNEQDTYRSSTYYRHAYNLDRMYMAGAQIKNRKHMGLNHEKLVILYSKGTAIFGSSNMSVPSSDAQDEHNIFTQDPLKFLWTVDHFERKWNAASEYEPFVPLPPDAPVSPSPANNSFIEPSNVTLGWEGGFWAWRYDIYFGTVPNPPLITSNVSTGFPGPSSIETYQLPPLQPGTTYYWRIVGKTMANIASTGPVWSFTTVGSGSPPPGPTGLLATPINSSRIDLSWSNVSGELSYAIERSLSSTSGWQEIGSTQADITSFQDVGLLGGTTYYYRVRAVNGAGFSPYSNTANATTPGGSTPSGGAGFLTDDFNDNVLDVSKWVKGQVTGSSDTSIQVNETNQQLQIGPLQNTSGFHFNGIVSNNAYDFTGSYAYLQVVTPPPVNSSAELRLSVVGANSPASNLYRYIIIGSSLKIQKVIAGGATNLVAPFAYNATSMKFLRVRHDSVSGNVVFETAPGSGADPNVPGAWTLRHQEAWVNWNGSSGVQLSAVRFEVRAGTATQSNNPGTITIDNFKAVKPAAAPTVTSVSPNSGPESGGTATTITGTGFSSPVSVSFGGVAATNVNVINSSTISATTPAHAPGAVIVVVTNNSDGQSGSLNNGYTFLSSDPGNEPPQVSASASPTSGVVPLIVYFTSSASDSDGFIVSYHWTFGDGGTSTMQSPSYSYQIAGTYVAQVTVTDDMGAAAGSSVTITVTSPGPQGLLADDFNDNVLDLAKWLKSQITGSSDANIQVNETNQQLQVGPLLQNTSGFHFNGIVSSNAFDFNGAYAYIQVVAPPPANSSAELRLSVAGANSPAANLYRYIIMGSTLKIQKVIAGTATNLVAPFAYNLTSMKFLRIRHDAASGNVLFETAPGSGADPNVPGAWSVRHQEAWLNWNGSSGVQLSAVRFEVRVGTATAQANNPGTPCIDNFKAAKF